jgi:hypothetical protein
MLGIRIALALLAAALAAGCIIEAPVGQSGSAPERPRVLPPQAIAPRDIKVGANLEDTVELVNAVAQPAQLVPGEQVKITLFFKVLKEIPDDYIVFVHLEDAEGRVERMNIDHRPVGGNYPTTQWKKGETVKDEFGVFLPPGLKVRGFNVWAGLWEPRSDRRMRLKNTDAVRNDGADRILVMQLPVLQ